MRASRLLSILMLLQTRGRMSAEALAAEVEVSVRTIYRDVDQLSAAGVPVYAERGRTGGFALLDGWRTRLTGLTAPEAQALFLAGLPGPASQLGLGEAMAAAQLKLLAALPAGWQEDARRVGARFHLDPVDWYRSAPPADHLPAVAAAIWSERRLRLRYERWSGTVERTVDPLGLVLKAGIWYLVAAVAGAPRTYRVSSILALASTDERFVRSRDFDLKAYWARSTKSFEAGLYRGVAELRVSPRGLAMLRGSAAAVAEAAQRTAGAPDRAGRVTVSIPIESIEHAAQQILSLGSHAEAIGPPALRWRIGEIASALAAAYRVRPGSAKR